MTSKTTGVYVIRHRSSGKVYIGSAVNIHRRWKDHKTRLNCKKHGNDYLQRAWTKYGSDDFEFVILETCSVEQRLLREQALIDSHNATDERSGFNMIPTRSSQNYGDAVTRLQLKRWSPFSKSERQQLCSHLFIPEHREKAQRLATAAKQTKEWSESRRHIAKLGLTTEATRAKNSARLKAMWQDPDFRAKRLAGLDRGREKTNAARRKPVIDEIV
jgi:group I intron endonuclease